MNTFLITGLDGAGKSTFLNRFKELKKENHLEIIFLPHIDLTTIEEDTALHNTAGFINRINCDADVKESPVMKTIAIFSAMLLYRKIMELHKKKKLKTIFCERHPLIDTMVYAKYYLPHIVNKPLPEGLSNDFNKVFENEIRYLTGLLPIEYVSKGNPDINQLKIFIEQWFVKEKKNTIADMQKLFQVDLPDKIYFLKAKPEILFERLKNRNRREVHESIGTLQMLDKAYSEILTDLNKVRPEFAITIDTTKIEHLDDLYGTIINEL